MGRRALACFCGRPARGAKLLTLAGLQRAFAARARLIQFGVHFALLWEVCFGLKLLVWTGL